MKNLLITRKHTGIGSDLISAACALDYAIKVNRDLIIDWRKSKYLKDTRTNLFSQLFDIPDEVEGVKIFAADPEFSDADLSGSVLRNADWKFDDYHRDMLMGNDRQETTLIVTRPMHHLPSTDRQKELLANFVPKPAILNKIKQFHFDRFGGSPVIGVHIRHGNGETLGNSRDNLIDSGIEEIYERCRCAIERFADPECSIFICTDSDDVRKIFHQNHKNAFSWSSKLRREMEGPIHKRGFGFKGAEDAVIEMWLLKYVHGMIYNPSWFSHYARIMGKFYFTPVNIDTQSKYGTTEIYHERVRLNSEAL